MIGKIVNNKIIFRKRNLNTLKPVFRSSNQERNSLYQIIYNINIHLSNGKIFFLKNDLYLGKYNLTHAKKIGLTKFSFDIYLTTLEKFKKYSTDFYPSIGRDFPAIVGVTSDTHERNLLRFFGFFEIFHKEIYEAVELTESNFTPKDPFEIFLRCDIIKCFIQHLLKRNVGGYNIKLHLRSIILSLLYLKRINNNNNVEEIIKECIMMQKCIQNRYVLGQSRDDLEQFKKWISKDQFVQCASDLYLNCLNWEQFLGPLNLPKCISEKCNTKKMRQRWNYQFFQHTSVMNQDSLLLNLLSCIPPPRTSNIRSLVIHFSNDDINFIKECLLFGVSTVIEVFDVPTNLVTLLNNYMIWIHCTHTSEEEQLFKKRLNKSEDGKFRNEDELELIINFFNSKPKLR